MTARKERKLEVRKRKKEMKKITLPTKKKKRLTAIQNDRTEFQTPEIPESKN